MTAAPLRVLIADPDPVQREGRRAVLDAQPDLLVVAQAADGEEALGLLRRVPVDVAVLDVRLPGTSGLLAAQAVTGDARIRLVQRERGTRVVLLTAMDLDRVRPAGVAAGADAVLWTDAEPAELLAAVRAG